MSACRLVATTVSSDCGLQHHQRRHRIDQHALRLDVGIVLRDFVEDLVPHHHAVTLRVRFRDEREMLARALAGELEGEAMDALDARAREDRDVHSRLRAGSPRCARPPLPAYSPSEFSRTMTQSICSPLRSGLVMPGSTRAGRTFAYWSKPWQIGSRSPHSET